MPYQSPTTGYQGSLVAIVDQMTQRTASAIGVGAQTATLDLENRSYLTVIAITSSDTGAAAVNLEISIDNSAWTVQAELIAAAAAGTVVNHYTIGARYARLVKATGGTASATLMLAAKR